MPANTACFSLFIFNVDVQKFWEIVDYYLIRNSQIEPSTHKDNKNWIILKNWRLGWHQSTIKYGDTFKILVFYKCFLNWTFKDWIFCNQYRRLHPLFIVSISFMNQKIFNSWKKRHTIFCIHWEAIWQND